VVLQYIYLKIDIFIKLIFVVSAKTNKSKIIQQALKEFQQHHPPPATPFWTIYSNTRVLISHAFNTIGKIRLADGFLILTKQIIRQPAGCPP
jgi:hypothetical protein